MIKKVLSVLFAVGMFLFLAEGCQTSIQHNFREDDKQSIEEIKETEGQTENLKNFTTIGVVLKNSQSTFSSAVVEAISNYVKSLTNVKIIIYSYGDTVELQDFQIKKMIVEGVDAIIYDPIDCDKNITGLELAKENGVPVVFLFDRVEKYKNKGVLFAPNYFEAGKLQICMAAEYLNAEGNIAIIKGLQETESEKLKSEGYEEALKYYTRIKVCKMQATSGAPVEGYAIMENWLNNNEKIDAVIAQNDDLAMAAYNAIEASGKSGEIAVFGCDGTKEMLKLIEEEKTTGTLYTNPEDIAKNSVDYVIAMLCKEKSPKLIFNFEKVTKNNVDQFL